MLGLAWTLALPVALMLVYLVVFSVLWKAEATDLDDYWLFLLCGLPPWAFFASSLQTSARSLVENAPLIRKVRFPRQLVPLAVVASQLVAFAVMMSGIASASAAAVAFGGNYLQAFVSAPPMLADHITRTPCGLVSAGSSAGLGPPREPPNQFMGLRLGKRARPLPGSMTPCVNPRPFSARR